MASPPEAWYIDMFFDLRLCVPVVINMVKSQIGVKGGWDWDPFHFMHIPAGFTWNNVSCFLLCLAAFFFISIEVHIRLRSVRELSIPITASLMGSLIFPQTLFWFTYPILILPSFWSSWIANIVKCFMGWLRGIASAAPICNISISATHQPPRREVAQVDERHPQEEQQINVEDGSLEGIGAEEQV